MERIREKILREIYRTRKDFWELLQNTDFLLADFINELKKMEKEKLICIQNGKIILTKKGKKLIGKNAIQFEPKICGRCFGKKIVLNEKWKQILKEYKKIVKERPLPTKQFFQGYMDEKSVIERVAFMHLNCDVYRKKIILIGDDDFTSIALALTNLPEKIFVVDIDPRIGDFINRVNKKYRLKIEFEEYDVSNPLPKKVFRKFDVFSTEPLETISGLKAFLLRGVACLKENSSGYFGLTHAEASLKKWLEIEKFLVKMNCVITDLLCGFSIYPTIYENVSFEEFAKKFFTISEYSRVNWYKSALFRIELIGKAKFPVSPFKKLKIDVVDRKEDLTIL